MIIYLPIMPIEMKWEVGDRNYSLNALPRMILLMRRERYGLEDVEKVTNLSAQAVMQEYQLLVEQGLIQEDGTLSDMAKAILDIYEFEDGHKEEKHLYYRDMARHLLLPQDCVEAVQSVPENCAWIDWPEHYNEVETMQNALEAKKKVFAHYEHLLEYYDIDFPLYGHYSMRKYFAKLDGQIKLVTKTEIDAEILAKRSLEEVEDKAEIAKSAEDTEDLHRYDKDVEPQPINLGLKAASDCWHLCASWQTESGHKYSKDECLLPWGEFAEYSDIVEADDTIPYLHLPCELSDKLLVVSAFVRYLWNNAWCKKRSSDKLTDFTIQHPEKMKVMCTLTMEDKPL